MGRARWIIGTGVLGLAGSAATIALAASGPPPVGSPAGCPLHEFRLAPSDRAGADTSPVPSGATSILVCDYSGFAEPPPLPQSGPAHRVIGDGVVGDEPTVQRLAGKLDALPRSSGPTACPADFGNILIAYFRYAAGADDPVKIGLSGCEVASNGHISRLGNGAPVIAQIAELAKPGTLKGHVQVCGGPAPGGCRTEKLTSCVAPEGCATTDRVAVLTAQRIRLVTVPLHHARFSVEVPVGRYELRLLADGRRVHGRVVQTAHARVRAGRKTSIVFGVSVP